MIDRTMVNPCGNTILNRSARRSGYYAFREAASAKNNKYRGTFTTILHHLVLLAISACGEIGQDAQELITALAEPIAEKRQEENKNEELPKAGVGSEMASIWQCCRAAATMRCHFKPEFTFAARWPPL